MEKKWKMEKKNNGENSGPLTSLPVDRLTATDCNADRSCQKHPHAPFVRFVIFTLGSFLFLSFPPLFTATSVPFTSVTVCSVGSKGGLMSLSFP